VNAVVGSATDSPAEKTFNIIDIVADPAKRDEFFDEVFNHTLRLA